MSEVLPDAPAQDEPAKTGQGIAKGKPYTRLTDMGAERLEEVRTHLKKGLSSMKLVKLIKADWGLFGELGDETLKKKLDRLRKDLRREMIQALTEKTVGKPTTALARKLDVHDELVELAIAQKARYQKMLGKEMAAPLLLKQVSEEIRNYQAILRDLAQLELEMGIIKRAPKQIAGQIMDQDGNVQQFVWTEEHSRLLEVIDAVDVEVILDP